SVVSIVPHWTKPGSALPPTLVLVTQHFKGTAGYQCQVTPCVIYTPSPPPSPPRPAHLSCTRPHWQALGAGDRTREGWGSCSEGKMIFRLSGLTKVNAMFGELGLSCRYVVLLILGLKSSGVVFTGENSLVICLRLVRVSQTGHRLEIPVSEGCGTRTLKAIYATPILELVPMFLLMTKTCE
ncbi:hypothetical protein BaRGS_00021861, partial [Batillaria attramentaria]